MTATRVSVRLLAAGIAAILLAAACSTGGVREPGGSGVRSWCALHPDICTIKE